MDVLLQLRAYYWKERWMLFTSIICLIISTAIGIVYPLLMRYLIDDIIKLKKYDEVLALALIVFGVIIVKAIFQGLHGLSGGRLGNRVAYNLRNALYRKLQYLSFQYYDKAKTGDLMSRLTADMDAVRQFIGFGFAQFLNLFLMVGFGATIMFTIHWQLTLITLVTMPLLVYTAIRFESRIHPQFQMMRQAMSNLTTAVQENITGVRTIKSFAREPFEVDKFTVRSDEYKNNQIGAAYIFSRYFPFMEIFSLLCVVSLLIVGGYLVINGSITIGDLVAFFSLIWFVIGPMWGVGFHINQYTQSKASGERVLEILNHYVHVKDREDAIRLPKDQISGHVQFDHVQFTYPDSPPTIIDFSLNAPSGAVIGILGGTGSGKSTIIQLLLRAYNVKEGTIKLDGHDIRGIQLESLRQAIGLVFQETFLFSSSIRNNISYGMMNASIEEIIRAAKYAQAHDFIMELPLGYDTIVGERGMGLSGGQKQRIAIARALIKNPKILIMDDSTSAVDMDTEHEIQLGLKEIMQGRTTFIIAHRISSLKHADEIIVLDNGKVIQRGNHQQLLEQDGLYRDTYDNQYTDQTRQLGVQS
ncbi:MAG: ABC transporter ATP-binding protein [Paenibacillaceae bacterium]